MTAREKNVLWVVGVMILLGLGYNYFFASPDTMNPDNVKSKFSYEEAAKLLQDQHIIQVKNEETKKQLTSLEKKFFTARNPEETQLVLLDAVEKIAFTSNLPVLQKTPVPISDREVGISLEGKCAPEALFRFIHQLTTAPLGFKVHRLQTHVISEQKQLDFQIVITSLLIEKKGK